ncbi:MAG TPA: hypothetical protein VFQ51_05315 [Vicinamibacteria bacterium]|nr:hypothetical protein [Vicinamibacteria bacterium]
MIATLDGATRMGMFLPANRVAFVLCGVLVGWTAARIAAQHPVLRERVLAFGVWTGALLVVYCQALSSITQLHWPGLLIVSGAGAVAELVMGGLRRRVASGTSLANALRGLPRDEVLALAVLLGPVAVYALWETWIILVSSEVCSDNVAYHLPRLGYWLQHQSVAPFLSNDPRSGTFPPNGNVLQLFPLLFLRTEQLSAFAQLFAFLGTGLAIFAIARARGAWRTAAVAAACCWFYVPAALSQANICFVDVIATFFTAATVAFAVTAVARPGWSTWTCLAAGALAVGTKTQVIAGVLPAVAVALGAAWRAGRRPTWRGWAGGVALVFVLAGVGLVQNQLLFGSPVGYESVAWVVGAPGWRTLALNVQTILAPVNPFPRLLSPIGSTEKWSLLAALSGQGLGLLWVVAIVAAFGRFGWRAIRGRPAPSRSEMGYVVVAAGFMLATLYVMRPQPSIARFVLPAVAVLSPLIANGLQGWLARPGWRLVPLALLSAAGSWILLSWGVADFKGRVRPGTRQFKSRLEMCDSPMRPVAAAFDELALRHAVPRVGVVSNQYFQQRFFFGSRYANVVVPLSYASEQELAALDRLALDAIWVEATFPGVPLFRRRFTPPPAWKAEWRYKSPQTFLPDFARAAEKSVEFRSFEGFAVRLGRRGSGWGVAFADSHGMLFTRQATTEDALALLSMTVPNGAETADGVVYSRLGEKPVYVSVFAGRAGSIAWDASVLPGAARRWPRRRVVVRDGVSGHELGPVDPAVPFELPVRGGLNHFILQMRSGAGSEVARRALAVGDLRLTWVR